MVDDLLSTRTRYATRTALESYTKEFEKKAQEERKLYIYVVKKSVKDIIKDEVKSLLPQILPKEVSYFATLMIQCTVNESLENVVLDKSSSQLMSTYEAAASLTEFELKKILLDKIEKTKSYQAAPEHRELYDRLAKSYNLDKDLFSTGKDAEPLKGLKLKESKTISSKGIKSQSKSSGKSVQAEEPMFETIDTKMPQDQGGPTFNPLKGSCKSVVELKCHFEECYKAVTDRLNWNKPESHEYPFDLSKTLSLIEVQGHQVFPADYFLNNDLEYLNGGTSSSKYTTSTIKTKAAKYDNIKGIENMVLTIIAVTHVKVMKWYDYWYLEEIVVQREDNILYKFMEGDFLRLNLRDIEDLFLLLVQKKLSNLEKDVIFDLNVALQMFTRHVVILEWVEDL
uniref:Uncharacterized protein n=1 Tax=Tanacetum cinerariifolium TaxID=118510 RepID=A0A6L2NQA8_TANCI|nr:hypothetical protein [Tanacetum cinerariifolium]